MAISNHLTITRKEKLKTVLAIVASYFLLNLPYAVNLLAEYGVQLKTATRQANVSILIGTESNHYLALSMTH